MPTSRSNKKNIIITLGDPSGIGTEVTLKALASPRIKGLADFLLIGDGNVVRKTAGRMGLDLKVPLLDLKNVPQPRFEYGKVDPAYGKASIEYLDKALELLRSKKADGLVTAPINKAAIIEAGYRGFEGHTEYMAERSGSKDAAMMFVGEKLKITLVTRHIALNNVSNRLSSEKIYKTISITDKYLKKYFKIRSPRIGVAGFNPHAGEGGVFGDEEDRIIRPAMKRASRVSKKLFGPVPPDVVFFEALSGKYDAVIAMYHDQGLIPFKMLYFKTGVNLTLGLPFVRTSPDHGTAFDIAGKGAADPSSMIEAIALACRLTTLC